MFYSKADSHPRAFLQQLISGKRLNFFDSQIFINKVGLMTHPFLERTNKTMYGKWLTLFLSTCSFKILFFPLSLSHCSNFLSFLPRCTYFLKQTKIATEFRESSSIDN